MWSTTLSVPFYSFQAVMIMRVDKIFPLRGMNTLGYTWLDNAQYFYLLNAS